MKIKLITVKVKDMEKSLEFYQGQLHLKVMDKINMPGQEMIFLCDEEGNTIELIQNDESKSLENEGSRVSFALEVDDIFLTIKDLEDKGVEIIAKPYKVPSGRVLAFVKDPNGILIEFLEKID